MAYRKLYFCYIYKSTQEFSCANNLNILLPKVINLQATKQIINRHFSLNNIKYLKTDTTRTTVSNVEIVKANVNLKEFKRLNFDGTKYILQTLHKLLSLTLKEAKAILKKHPDLRITSQDIIEKNYWILHEEGISVDIIKKFPNLLTLTDTKTRINYLKKMPLNMNSTAPLMSLNLPILQKIVFEANIEAKTIPYGNRITYLSKKFNIPEWEISEKLIKHHYILNYPFERLSKIVKILLDYGIDPNNIMRDFWSLRYSPALAEKRLQRAVESNVDKVKTWMIRCPNKVIERCITRQVENRKILGSDSSVEEYLSKRLECTIENAKYLIDKYPALEKMNISKMKEIMDYLFKLGYTPGHICRVPRILIHGLETTKSRLIQLKQVGYVPISLAILCKSKRDYDKYVKKYCKK